MKTSHLVWSVVIGVVALTPFGLKALTWLKPRPHAQEASADAGKTLFLHEWVPNDPLSASGDGLGPVYNANSCVACHQQGGPGGGGGLQNNVTTFTLRSNNPAEPPHVGVVHARAVKPEYQETLAKVHPELPANVSRPSLLDLVPLPGNNNRRLISFPTGVQLSQRNTPALFGAKWIDELSDQDIVANERAERLQWGLAPGDRDDAPVGRAPRLPGGKIGRFGWKAQTASLGEFVQAACANELGLGNPDHDQPTPLGKTAYRAPALDLTTDQCNQLTAFVSSLPRPVERLPDDAAGRSRAEAGKAVFKSVGCADCHAPNVGPVEGIYSDLLLHRMGQDLNGDGYYGVLVPDMPVGPSAGGPDPSEWRTPPLWGVADSAPYMHDGRAATLEDAIKMHGGQAASTAKRFAALSRGEQGDLVAFLKTLRAP